MILTLLWGQHRNNTFQEKTLKTAEVRSRRSVENSVLFEEIREEGLRGWEIYQRNMEAYVPVSWPRACHITRNLWSTNLSKAQCGRILKNWTWGSVQRYPGKDSITSIHFHSQCFPFTLIPYKTPLVCHCPIIHFPIIFPMDLNSPCWSFVHTMPTGLISLTPITLD